MIKITADSATDLGYLFKEKNIEAMPLFVNLGGEEYKDGVDITPEKIFTAFETNKVLPKTAAQGIDEYVEFFRRVGGETDTVIHFSISSHISTSYNSASKAAERLKNVYAVDSLSLSCGAGILALTAREMADRGASVKEILEKVNDMRAYVQVSTLIPTMTYLHAGGRCGAILSLVASVLSVRPVAQVKNGKLSVGSKFMGSLAKNSLKYVESTLTRFSKPDPKYIFVVHALAEQSVIDAACEKIREKVPDANIYVMEAGSTICSHTGRGAIAVLYLNGDKVSQDIPPYEFVENN